MWERRFKTLPANMSSHEIGKRYGTSHKTAWLWAKRIGYSLGPTIHTSPVYDWSKADWSNPNNAEIGRAVGGASRERVRQMRARYDQEKRG